MSSEMITFLDSERVLYLKYFLILFSLSIVSLTVIFSQSKSLFPYALSLALFLNLGFFVYLNGKYRDKVFDKLIPLYEKKLDAKFYKSNFLTIDKINNLNIFAHEVNSLKSDGYFKNDKQIVEFLKISFVKKDTEENEIENILFEGKVVITNKDLPSPKCDKEEYFEAGESLKVAKRSCKVKVGDDFYYFYSAEKLFPNINIFLKPKL